MLDSIERQLIGAENSSFRTTVASDSAPSVNRTVYFFRTKDGENWEKHSLNYRGPRNASLVIGISSDESIPMRVAYCSLGATGMGGRAQHATLEGVAAPRGYLPVKASLKSLHIDDSAGKREHVLEIISWSQQEAERLAKAGHPDPNFLLTAPRLSILRTVLEVDDIRFVGDENGEASIAKGYAQLSHPKGGIDHLTYIHRERVGD